MSRGRGNKTIDLHRARERILKMVASDSATFSMTMTEKHREEYVDVRVEYAICGTHYERAEGRLKIILNVNSMSPANVDVDMDKFRASLGDDVARNLPFLIKDTYILSFDMQSLRAINKEGELTQFREEMAMAIEMHGLSMDEVLPTIVNFIRESLPESSYGSMEELLEGKPNTRDRPVLEITPPGVPCPYCNCSLSEDALRSLLMKLYMRFRGDRFDH